MKKLIKALGYEDGDGAFMLELFLCESAVVLILFTLLMLMMG